jgi:hypothetical protein
MPKYSRVIPRDFFNEAKLLKCMGILSLKIHDRVLPEGVSIGIVESGEPFNIQLSYSGELYISNYSVLIQGTPVYFYTTYNSKEDLPFYCCTHDGEEIQVFNPDTSFTPDFVSLCKSL